MVRRRITAPTIAPLQRDLSGPRKSFGVPLYPFFLEGVAADAKLNQADGCIRRRRASMRS
jgi:hypothetical protein